MNKKILGTALLAGMAIGMGSTAFAANTADITFSQSPSYVLSIPQDTTIDAQTGEATIQFGTSSRNILPNKNLVLSIKWDTPASATTEQLKTFNLVNSADNNIVIPSEVKDGNTVLSSGDSVQTYSDLKTDKEVKNYTVAFKDPSSTKRAGEYSGTLTFVGEYTD